MLENGEVQPMEVKKNDKVLFGSYAGTEIKIGGEERLILREEDILCVVEPGEEVKKPAQKKKKKAK
jgi:chaperonin GroES